MIPQGQFVSDRNHPAICIVSHEAYGALTGGNAGHIGGVERQTSLMARWLAARGHRISLLTWDEGQPSDEVVQGVRIIKMCRRDAGVPGVRFCHPRWTSLNRALRTADADVYYHNCAEYVTGQVVLWCRLHGKRFVYSVANDPDVDPRLPDLRTRRERILYRYGIAHADCVIVQTRKQQSCLRAGFGLTSVVIPMPCPGSEGQDEPSTNRPPTSARVLWVARICRQKRPDRLLDLAAACPELHFDLVGPAGSDAYAQDVCRRALQLPNITVHGRVERERMPQFYQQAACLCCTSDFEGFPNTFLEAWSHRLPVVSTFDPDDLIATRGLGAVAGDVAGLATGIRRLITSPDEWRAASSRARQYYLENHTVEKVMPQFERVFLEVAGRTAARVLQTT